MDPLMLDLSSGAQSKRVTLTENYVEQRPDRPHLARGLPDFPENIPVIEVLGSLYIM